MWDQAAVAFLRSEASCRRPRVSGSSDKAVMVQSYTRYLSANSPIAGSFLGRRKLYERFISDFLFMFLSADGEQGLFRHTCGSEVGWNAGKDGRSNGLKISECFGAVYWEEGMGFELLKSF